jgi:hypothetical protein
MNGCFRLSYCELQLPTTCWFGQCVNVYVEQSHPMECAMNEPYLPCEADPIVAVSKKHVVVIVAALDCFASHRRQHWFGMKLFVHQTVPKMHSPRDEYADDDAPKLTAEP